MYILWMAPVIAFICVVHIILVLTISKRQRKDIAGKHVVITGGSKGIGLSLAVECVLQEANITLIARNEGTLIKAMELLESHRISEEQKFQYHCLDVSSPYDTVAATLAKCEENFGKIYALFNCAGFGICGLFEEIPVADAHELMNVNYFGTYNCTRYVVTKMKQAREGIIVITAAQVALLGVFGYGAYAATKFALRGLAETLAMETRHCGISVTLALPADTNTPGYVNEDKTKPIETKLLSGIGGLANPRDVAQQILVDALDGNFISVYGFESWVLTVLGGGLFRWESFLQTLAHAFLITELCLIGTMLHAHCERIIKKCARTRNIN